MRFRPIYFVFATLLLDCATLDKLPTNTCGNGVVDADEDCDTFPAGQCGEPSAGEAKCRLKCGKQTSGSDGGSDGGSEVLACPDGWGCSVSGFCRQPTGTFSAASEPVSAGVTTMLVGDFDGDGRKDVLGASGATSKGRIHYFKDGAAPQVVALPGVLAAPVVFDVDADGRSDIAFGYSFRGAIANELGLLEPTFAGGYAIMLGQTDRAVVTKLFPTFTQESFEAVIIPIAAKPKDLPVSAAGDPHVAVATFRTKEGTLVTLLRSLDGDPADLTMGFAKLLPGAIADLAGDPMTGRIFDGVVKSACGEIVVPFKIAGGARIQIYSPCTRIGPVVVWSKDDPKEIAFPGETLERIFVADVDDDRHVDIVIGTTLANGKSKVRVAYGNATGTDLEIEDAPSDLTDVPLAAGLLNDDLRLDFVIPGGVLLSAPPKGQDLDAGAPDGGGPAPPRAKLPWIGIPRPTKRWTVAQIADVNRDGVLDVIAGSQFEPDIDVLEGTRSVNMPPFSIPTTGSVTNLVVGDFDFDGNGDIAFVQARPASSDREIAIAYGRPLTMPPESPRPAGRLDGIRQIFVNPAGITITSASAGKTGELSTFSLAILLSSGERQPVAPLLFGNEAGDDPAQIASTRRELSTRALVAASRSAPGAIDLIGLVQQSDYARATGKREADPTYGVWVAAGTGPTSFSSPMKLPFEDLPGADRASDTFLIQIAAGDVDGDKKQEIVAASPDQNGTGALLLVIRLPSSPAEMPVPQFFPIPDRTTPGGVRAQLLDVDGDGNLDFVAILTNGQKKKAEVNVFFGDGKASFAIPGVVMKVPQPMGASFDEFTALGFTQITTGGGSVGVAGGKRRELAIVTPKHLFRAFVRPDRSIETVEATSPFGVITYGSSVVAGDFDGDGVEDLAIADQGSIRIARQIARLR